jgi:hypothetical protein
LEAQRRREEAEQDWRASMARKLQVMSPDEYTDWLISGRTREEKRRYFRHDER